MDIFVRLLGPAGIIGLVGIICFSFTLKYSQGIFDWIEKQTYGTKSYILEKLELLFIEVNPDKLTNFLLLISVGSGTIVFTLFVIFGHWIIGLFLGLMCSFIGFKVPRIVINFLVKRRVKSYSGQMVDALTLLANGLRAGLSVPQAIGMVVDELPAPVSQEFNLMLQQNKIGVPLEECFEALVKRIPTEDNEMFVSSVNILRETGGNLAETFDTIVDVIRERIRLQQKIETFVAQGMFQGLTIFLMPFVLLFMFYSQDPVGMRPVFTTPIGWGMLSIALLLDLIGGFIIIKIVDIKV